MAKYIDELTYDFARTVTPPVRETRIGVCSAYCGGCGQLTRDVKAGCAQLQSRKFAQSGGCQLNLALGIVSSFTNVVVIVHSPLGCSSNFLGSGGLRKTMRASKGKPAEEFIWLHTNMTEVDVIHGGLDKLRRAILYAETRYHPEAIIVANGCVPGIIGDDIDSLASELDGRISAKIVPVHCEGLKSRYVASGYDSAYHALLRHLADPIQEYGQVFPDEGRDALKRYNISRTVNIFNVGSNSSGDEAELSRIVASLGLIPRVLPLHASLDDLARIGEAALNVSICATHDDYLLGHLKERFGIPYIIDTLPIGIRSTNQWVREIAKFFGLEEEAERVIELENTQLQEALKPFRAVLEGKSVYVGGGELRILTTADFFARDLGMKLTGIKAHNVDRFVEDIIDDLFDPNLQITVAAGQPAEELNLLKKLKPDLYCGHGGANGWSSRLGIPSIPLYGQTLNYMGYLGAYELARKAAKALKNTNFSRNISRNVGLPLSKAWFESDTSDNIKQSELAG
ncbi:nitrogenase molybdenum-iron protein alpha chain [Sporobacter termitidis DSM 10068]|uniref:Nitrogenase molybdenum-iron protein alpha chain n=1 Tax=Sporobacter termitidis DSM 10068 TaxID=1123282 RepID=A0A1M5XFM9_9FIRM|nr:nitrogenase component 1 [Sporobacter termitidis]SHH98358.1 nitrogenase molybdenum-iron protein alpha chain [Sporobacter termitidis DSM 10068]